MISCVLGAVFTYKAHYEHPQYSYLPADQEWRDHLHEVVDLARRQTDASAAAELLVDVAGAVVKPGVYQVNAGGRIQEAILAAGGFAVEADQQYIHQKLNLADLLHDRSKIYIPFTGEIDPSVQANTDASVSTTETSQIVNLNTASSIELQSLTGIGDKRATEIIAARPIANEQDLIARTSIGASILTNIIADGFTLTY